MLPQKTMHVLVTGAASGIGLTVTKLLLDRGHKVTAMVRNAARATSIQSSFSRYNEKFHICFADLASFASLEEMVEKQLSQAEKIDVVVHCAGMLMPPGQQTLTEDGFEITLQVNAVSVWYLSQLLLPLLNRPARIIALTSSLHKPGSRGAPVRFDFEDFDLEHDYHCERAYKNSKLALIWVLREWERHFGKAGVHADAICPGFVPTTAARYTHGFSWFLLRFILPLMPFAVSRKKSAHDIVKLVEEPADAPGGRYFENDRLATPSADALDDTQAKRFLTSLQGRLNASF